MILYIDCSLYKSTVYITSTVCRALFIPYTLLKLFLILFLDNGVLRCKFTYYTATNQNKVQEHLMSFAVDALEVLDETVSKV